MNLFWQTIPSTEITEILCSSKIDGIVLDMEHGSFTIQNMVDSIRVITLKGKLAVVRLKENKRIEQIAVDNGCGGIIHSTVESNMKPSWGIGLTRGNNYGNGELTEKYIIRIAQIETVAGLNAVLDRRISNYDYYMLTPYDFSKAIGKPGQFKCKEYVAYEELFKSAILEEMRACHIVRDVWSVAEKYKDYGLKCWSMDSLMILEGTEQHEQLF